MERRPDGRTEVDAIFERHGVDTKPAYWIEEDLPVDQLRTAPAKEPSA